MYMIRLSAGRALVSSSRVAFSRRAGLSRSAFQPRSILASSNSVRTFKSDSRLLQADEAAPATDLGDGLTQTSETSAQPTHRPNTIYVSNLLFGTTGDDLMDFFREFGEVKSSNVIRGPDGRSRGIGFVEFDGQAPAEQAIEAKNMTFFHGRQIRVQLALRQREARAPREPSEPTNVIWIGNLGPDVTDDDLNRMFLDIPNVQRFRLARERGTKLPRGFAHLQLKDIESAHVAKDLLQQMPPIQGNVLKIDFSNFNPFKRRDSERPSY